MLIKILIDRCCAVALLLLLSPLLLLITLLIRTDGGPAIFRQARLGLGGREFTIYKFRSMIVGADRYLDSRGRATTDRITPIGRILRKTSLDELPQLWNIAKGDMSFIGPRPTLPAHLKLYTNEQRRRFLVRPGVTGLAQISGRNELRWSERIVLDIEYVDNYSLWRDICIAGRTVLSVIRGSDVVMDRNPDQVNDLQERTLADSARANHNFPLAADALNAALAQSTETSEVVPRFQYAGQVDGDDIIVVGNPRSGTTLLYQICASYLGFSYFSNLAALTWEQPELGLSINERFRNDSVRSELRSSWGQTADWHEPHEGGRIWESLLGVSGMQQPDAHCDLERAIGAMQRFRSLTGRKMVYKGLFLTWSIAELAQRYPTCRFIHVSRSLPETCLSLLSLYRSRDVEDGFTSLVSRAALEFETDPLPERIAAQVHFNDVWIRDQLQMLPAERVHEISTESLLFSPENELPKLAEFAGVYLLDAEREQIEHQLRQPVQGDEDTAIRERIVSRLDALRAVV